MQVQTSRNGNGNENRPKTKRYTINDKLAGKSLSSLTANRCQVARIVGRHEDTGANETGEREAERKRERDGHKCQPQR